MRGRAGWERLLIEEIVHISIFGFQSFAEQSAEALHTICSLCSISEISAVTQGRLLSD